MNPQDPTKNHPDKVASTNKVIVLSMKNMPSFKFDPSKGLFTDPTQSVFSLNPRQLQTSQIAAAQPKVLHQVVHQIPPSSVVKTVVIRAQLPAASAAKPQFTSLASCSNVKIQESTNVNKDCNPQTLTTFRTKATNEIATKTSSDATTTLKSQQVVYVPNPNQPGTYVLKTTPQLSRIGSTVKLTSALLPEKSNPPKLVPKTYHQAMRPVPIRPKVDPPTLVEHQPILQKWSAKGVFHAPVPALTLIQPKPQPAVAEPVQPQHVEEESDEAEEFDEEEEEFPAETDEKLRQAQEERIREVKRIIEGDQDEIAQQVAIIQQHSSSYAEDVESDNEPSEEPASIVTVVGPTLLCDERIESVSTEISPTSEPDQALQETPSPMNDDTSGETRSSAVEGVRKNLEREMSMDFDKENMEMAMDEVSDDSSMTDSQRAKLHDYEESLLKSEIARSAVVPATSDVSIAQGKPKRARKPKNPTIIASLGLPYKPPSQNATRKSKVEKKLEFELDFHDPINKIQWEDGIGGLSNCNKLFGFDEFGLIEVLNKKDALAKLNQLDVKDEKDDDAYKLREIVDPADQFVCAVCSKPGTIRNFYTPDCCSESCMSISKRKANEFNAGKESSSSGITTPSEEIDEKKMVFGGELVPLQQLQLHLLEQQLPESKRGSSKMKPSVSIPDTKFQWDSYLTTKSIPAGLELFKNPYPRGPNPFKVGMKLEVIDPDDQRKFCVATVEEKVAYRIKLHFDGYTNRFDFWVNADSQSIFYAGFCQNTNRVLQTPPKWNNKKFDWSEYLDYTNSIGAPRNMFPRLKSSAGEDNHFEVGMKLESMRDGKLYAASIIDVLENRVLVSHDNHEEIPCAWLDIHSPYLHPCNYHKTIADPETFIPPSRPFEWNEYLKATDSKEAPSEILFFKTRSPFKFEPGLKLEVVDKVNSALIRPATILCREGYKIQVIYDGFDIFYAYWLDDDSEDIHPINWCEKTGHPVEHPAGFNKSLDNDLCPKAGCRGVGNGLFPDRYFHDNIQECPYSKANWKRFASQNSGSHLEAKPATKRRGRPSTSNGSRQTSTASNRGYRLKVEPDDDIGYSALGLTDDDIDDTDDEISANQKAGSNLEVKPTTKRRGRPSTSNGSRQISTGGNLGHHLKQESDDNVDYSAVGSGSVDDVIVKKRGRKRKSVTVAAADEENKASKVARTFAGDYGPQIGYSLELWKKNSKVLDRAPVADTSTGNPMEWSVAEVSSFVGKITSDEKTIEKFHGQEIDGATFVCLCQEDLLHLMNIKMGIAIKIYNRILHLREEILLKFIKI